MYPVKDKKIIILGKMPPPYMGTSVWFETLRQSSINRSFEISWFNVNVHKEINTLGKKRMKSVWSNIGLFYSFRKTLKAVNPQLVVIPVSQSTLGFLKDSVYIRLAKKRTKVLVMLHGSDLQNWLNYSEWLMKRYVQSTFKGTNGAIVLGERLRYLFKEWYADEEIFVVPNGLNLDFSHIARIQQKKLIIRYLSNLQPSKGIRESLEGFSLVSKDKPILEMRITGHWRDMKTKEWCEKLVKQENLPVIFEGPAYGEDKLNAFVNSDIFVFTPNKPEGHPFVIIEAMAAGLPIISTDQGAITESVIDGENGFIVPPRDPAAIAEKLKLLIEDRELREIMGRRSRELYEQNFTGEKMVEKLTHAINSILGI